MCAWGRDARLRFRRRSLGAFPCLVGKIPIIGVLVLMALASLSTSGQAHEVTVIVKGVMSLGSDETGVFGKAGYSFGADDVFTVVYSINDTLGQNCGEEYSCIEQSPLTNPMTSVTLMITGPDLPGNTFTFVNNPYAPKTIKDDAYRLIQLGGSTLSFYEDESYTGYQTPGTYAGGSWVNSVFTVANTQILSNCWEESLDDPQLPGNSDPGSGFFLNVWQWVSGEPDILKRFVAQGSFNIKNITILGLPFPTGPCFVGK